MYTQDKIESARRLIDSEITRVISISSLIGNAGCAACHILFTLTKTLSLNESDAGDLLSQALFENPQLNDRFIEMVEKYM